MWTMKTPTHFLMSKRVESYSVLFLDKEGQASLFVKRKRINHSQQWVPYFLSNTQTSDLKSYIHKQHKTDIVGEGEGGMNLSIDIWKRPRGYYFMFT